MTEQGLAGGRATSSYTAAFVWRAFTVMENTETIAQPPYSHDQNILIQAQLHIMGVCNGDTFHLQYHVSRNKAVSCMLMAQREKRNSVLPARDNNGRSRMTPFGAGVQRSKTPPTRRNIELDFIRGA